MFVCLIIRDKNMAFRADEEIARGYESALRYLVPKEGNSEQRARAKRIIEDLVDELGPVIDSYPSWHPLVSSNDIRTHCVTIPGSDCGYVGLDHTIYFAHGFVTCPYDDGQRILNSVENLPENPSAIITAERLDEPLYNLSANAIVVKCEWKRPFQLTKMIPKSIAVPLLLEQEIPHWRTAQCAETWETMRPYFLGTPNGSRSSLFLTQETGQVLKTLWNTIINTGMYGNIRVD
jgi:hypothetical protein